MSKLYRFKGNIGVRDDLKLGINALKVMERRYLLRDEDGYIIETPTSLFQRVAHAIASAETNFDPAADVSSRNRICWRLPARDMSLLGHLEIVISYYHHPSLPATSGYNLLRMH